MMSPPFKPELYATDPRATSSTSTPLFTPNVSRRSAFVRTIVAPAITDGGDGPENTNTLRGGGASAMAGAGSVALGTIGAGVAIVTVPFGLVETATGASPGCKMRTRWVVAG